MDYLIRILNAKVYDVAKETSLTPAPLLSQRLGNRFSSSGRMSNRCFHSKLRGAYNKMAHLGAKQLAAGVVAASSGNHAQGVALAAQKLGTTATIVMPKTTPVIKVDAVRSRGANIVLFGESYSESYGHALTLAKARGRAFIHPYDDPMSSLGKARSAWRSCASIRGRSTPFCRRRRRWADLRNRGLCQSRCAPRRALSPCSQRTQTP